MATAAPDDLYPVRRRKSKDWLPPFMSELKLVLLGNSWSERSSLGNFILGKTEFSTETELDKCLWVRAKIQEKDVFIINTPDLLSPNISRNELTDHVTDCVRLSDPGPHVFLLVLQPEEFTKEQKKKLRRILKRFSHQSFDQTLILIPREQDSEYSQSPAFRQLIRECRNRYLLLENLDHSELLTCLGQIVRENNGEHVSCDVFKDPCAVPALNLVLCGRRGAGKSSAAKAILGQTGLHSASTSSECVQHQGEVCGRLVSLVDLPALSGKPLETVMKESLRSVSLCDPEGVHAFILVLPVGPLTDEDKGELKIIQDVFGSQVNDFTMILFITVLNPTAPALVNFLKKNEATQELVQSCGGRHFVLNIKNQQQIPELLNMVEKMRLRSNKDKPSFTTETFALAQTEKINTLQAELKTLKTRCPTSCEEVKQSSERLRIVLIGKTGNGKSSSGNTILGRKEFVAKSNQTAVTRDCQKAHGEVDGRPVSVVDTPGLFDDSFSNKKIHEEMIKCFNLLAPGPHVFLLVLHIGRFTKEEKKTIKLIREGFGKDAEKFTIILLTGGDTLEYERCSIEEYVKSGCDKSFKKLISDCGGRYHVLNNRDEGNREQVSELIKKIDTLVKTNGGRYFTNAMLQEAEAAIKKETERLMKEKGEEMRKGSQKLQGKHEEEMKEMEERRKKQREDFEREREKEQVQENEQIQSEEQTKLKKMQEKYETERENDRKKRQEEDRIRKKEEEKEKKAMEDAFKTEMENLKKKYEEEEEARKKAEECNEFKEKYTALEKENEKLKKKRGGRCTIL